jgi:hypothetical protein
MEQDTYHDLGDDDRLSEFRDFLSHESEQLSSSASLSSLLLPAHKSHAKPKMDRCRAIRHPVGSPFALPLLFSLWVSWLCLTPRRGHQRQTEGRTSFAGLEIGTWGGSLDNLPRSQTQRST